jgi:hypothetical protein
MNGEIKSIECRHCRAKRLNDGTRCAGCGLYENNHIKPYRIGSSGTMWIDDRHITHAQEMLIGKIGEERVKEAPKYNRLFEVLR